MTRLIIDGKTLDLFTDEHIELKKSISQLTSLTGGLAEFTKKFNIPATNNNNHILKFYGLIDIDNVYNPHKGIDAVLLVEEIHTINGQIELNSVNYTNDELASYAITFYGELVDLKTKLTEIVLNDTDAFTSLDSIINRSNIISSWTTPGNVLFPLIANDRDFVYALDKEGEQYPDANENNIASNELGASPSARIDVTGIKFADIKPAYNFSEVIRLIFLKLGITISYSTVLAAYLDNMYVMPSSKAGSMFSTEEDENRVKCNLNDVAYSPDAAGARTKIGLISTEDPAGNWSDTTHVYTVPITGDYTFDLKWQNHVPFNSFDQIVGYAINAVNITDFEITYHLTRTTTKTTVFTVPLEAGEKVNFYFGFIGAPGDYDHDITLTQLTTTNIPLGLVNANIVAKNTFPSIDAYTFISGLIKSWNLLPVPLGDNQLLLTDCDSYYAGGKSKDWSAYLDVSKMVVNKAIVAKEYDLKYKDANDRISKFFVEYQARETEYAELQFFTDADFGKDKETIQSLFTIIAPSYMDNQRILSIDGEDTFKKLGTTDLPLHPQMNDSGSPVQSDFLLFYFNGNQAVGNVYYLQDAVKSTGEITYKTAFSFPYISSVQDFPSLNVSDGDATNSNTLSYSNEYPLSGAVAPQTAFKLFYDDYLQRMLDVNTRLITVDGLLPVGEYVNFKLSDKITFENNSYTVQEIDYDFLDETIKVKLMTYNPDYLRWDMTPLNALGETTVCHKLISERKCRLTSANPFPAAYAKSFKLVKKTGSTHTWVGGASYISPDLSTGGGLGGAAGYHKYIIDVPTATTPFVVGDVLAYYTKAWRKADSSREERTAQGVVVDKAGTKYTIIRFGDIKLPLHGYDLNTWYWLDTDGTYTKDRPAKLAQLLFYVYDIDTLQFNIEQPITQIEEKLGWIHLGENPLAGWTFTPTVLNTFEELRIVVPHYEPLNTRSFILDTTTNRIKLDFPVRPEEPVFVQITIMVALSLESGSTRNIEIAHGVDGTVMSQTDWYNQHYGTNLPALGVYIPITYNWSGQVKNDHTISIFIRSDTLETIYGLAKGIQVTGQI